MGQLSIRVLGFALVNHRDRVTVVERSVVFDLVADCFLFFPISSGLGSKLFCIVALFPYILRVEIMRF